VDLQLGNLNLSRRDLVTLKRALTDSEIAGVLEDPVVRQGIAQLVIYRNPLIANIPRMSPASAGQAAAIVTRRAAGSTPGAFVADTDSITEDTGTPSQASFTYRTVATRMKVTRIAQLIGASYVDVFAQEATSKAADFSDFIEKELIAGSNSDNAKSWDGINELVPNANVVKMTTADGTGAALTQRKARKAIDLAKGMSRVFVNSNDGKPSRAILTSEGGGQEFDALIDSTQRNNDKTEVAGGFRVSSYDGIPILRTNVYGSAIHNNSASYAPSRTELLGATGSTTVAYFLNFSELWFEELEKFTTVPLATTDSQFDQADMRQTGAVVLRDTTAISMLTAITVS
jgi:hypothetical protein